MTQKEIQFVNDQIYAMFLPIACDSIDSGAIADAITDEVVEDIMETADPNGWNSEDIRIAVTRVIKNKLNID
jgi:hypothetical protein